MTAGPAELKPADLAAWLASERPPQLVAALTPWQFGRVHIPGSLWFTDVDHAVTKLHRVRPVVVYGPAEPCPAARFAERALRARGFEAVVRLDGGLEAWVGAHRPVAGALA